MRVGLALAALVLAGCAHGPALNTYRLVRQDRVALVVPPNVKGPELVWRTFVAEGVARGKGTCEAGGPVTIAAKGKGLLRLTVDRDALGSQAQPGWLSDWAIRAETQGCVAAGQAQALARSIVESVPLDSEVAYRLLHANAVRSGFVDLGPENALEVRSPIVSAGAADAPVGEITAVSGEGTHVNVDLKLSASVIGFETAWYGIQANPSGVGLHFVPLTADRTVQGVVTRGVPPSTDYLRFPPKAAHFRLFYKSDDNGVTAIVIAGATRPELDERTKAVSVDAGVCDKQQGMCVTLPRRVGLNPFLVVKVNGQDVRVSLGATVRNALIQSGERSPEAVVPQLHVTRLYGGQARGVEFDRRTEDILNLKLAGGETIATAEAAGRKHP